VLQNSTFFNEILIKCMEQRNLTTKSEQPVSRRYLWFMIETLQSIMVRCKGVFRKNGQTANAKTGN